MKVSKLIRQLQIEMEENGDINVRLICDHSQSLMSPTGSGLGYIEDDFEYMGEEIAGEYLEEYPDAVKVIVIEAF